MCDKEKKFLNENISYISRLVRILGRREQLFPIEEPTK